MNALEKKSFYSFLALYIISSTLFVLLSGYWYYSAQKSALESNDYYKLQHIADTYSQMIIASHMRGEVLPKLEVDQFIWITLVDTNGHRTGSDLKGDVDLSRDGYSFNRGRSTLISSAPQEHHNIRYLVLQSEQLALSLAQLKTNVMLVMGAVIALMIFLAWWLSRLFMRPIHDKIRQIEDFVHDTAHELNTPITALNMSVSRALSKQEYDEKVLKNISISTKQLFDMYRALAYLSFESERKVINPVDIQQVLEKSVAYYRELAESKRITLQLVSESYEVMIDEVKLMMLFGNLINNAIKYSPPSSTISMVFEGKCFSIQDQGIGIEAEKISKIYEKYNRATEYAGGFGIGLSIVKKIALEHGLELKVDSTPNKGTCFRIIFP